MIENVCHIGPAFYVQGGISSVLRTYKKLFNLSDKNFLASYNGSFLKSLPLLFLQCAKLIIKPKKDIAYYQIHTSSYGSFYRKYLISLCLRLHKKKYTVHIHGSMFDKFCNQANPVVKKMLNNYFSHAEYVFILSGEMKNIVLSVAPSINKFVTVPNPCEFVTDAPVDLSSHVNPVKIVFSGRYGDRKGVFDLLKAFELAEFKVPVRLYLYGDGQIERVQKAISANSKKEYIEMSKWLDHQKYLNLLPSFDLLVLPSYAERFSMSLVESLGLGLPVISTYVGGTAEIVENGVCGLLVQPGDIDALKISLEKIVNNRDMRIKMGAAGWKRVHDNFTGDVVMKKLDDAYLGLK